MGTNKSTCPLNPKALSHNTKKHPLAGTVEGGPAEVPTAKPKKDTKAPIASRPKPKGKVKMATVSADYMNAAAPRVPRGQVKRDTESWTKRKPKSMGQRSELIERCGPKCFLNPETKKYPVCAKTGGCDYDCDGIRAARNMTYIVANSGSTGDEARARALSARDRAQRLGVEYCGWK